mmetsp:Transcript_35485/g.89056  ORF Transcript_35485/g.89056 Transcript_35485/m.89056 type:complete len:224 (+) Transcript_35485:659-1330(+)
MLPGLLEAVQPAVHRRVGFLVLGVLLRLAVRQRVGGVAGEELVGGDADHDVPVRFEPPERRLLILGVVVVLDEGRAQADDPGVPFQDGLDLLVRPGRGGGGPLQEVAVLDVRVHLFLCLQLRDAPLDRLVQIFLPKPCEPSPRGRLVRERGGGRFSLPSVQAMLNRRDRSIRFSRHRCVDIRGQLQLHLVDDAADIALRLPHHHAIDVGLQPLRQLHALRLRV